MCHWLRVCADEVHEVPQWTSVAVSMVLVLWVAVSMRPGLTE